jgi:hypothetical protein
MDTKYAFIITGDRYALDILQAHAELIRKYDDKTLYNITEVTRSEDKGQLFVSIEDEVAKVERFRDMIHYRFPSVSVMKARIKKSKVENNG